MEEETIRLSKERYRKEKVVSFLINFRVEKDEAIINELLKQKNKTDYIRKLILDDLESRKEENG